MTMRTKNLWMDRISTEDRTSKSTIHSIAFKPDGSECLVAVDVRILIYDPADGQLMQTLKGHKDTVYAVAWSHDGETFASGSADKSVIIWSSNQHEGLLKYSHAEAIQCLAFNPTTPMLLSCAFYDFAIWTSAEKNVQKQRIQARATSCCWNKDGTVFAVGTIDGSVFLRKLANFTEEPYARIDRPSGEPVWAIKFCAPKPIEDGSRKTAEETLGEFLTVTDWSKSFACYDMNGQPIANTERNLDFEPTCMDFASNDKFIVLGGTGKEVYLYTRMGLCLGRIAEIDSWIWTLAVRPQCNSLLITVGCVDGTLACYGVSFSIVHGLHRERYAYRDNMTEVVVQHFGQHASTRIKCHESVKKIAVYGDKLAVQLDQKLLIYRQIASDREKDSKLSYRIESVIDKQLDCQLLVVCSRHLILCEERRLQAYDHYGRREREWILESWIRYIKVIGGPPGRETILVGLKGGEVCKIFVDNPFPVVMLRLNYAIKCLDMSISRRQLAVVSDNSVCTVYDTKTMERLFAETECNSVAINTENENIICYSTNLSLTIRAGHQPGYKQRMAGFVVGFIGNRVYCLQAYNMSSTEVPFSNQLYQYIENKEHSEAYKLANLGVTEDDWNILALDALNYMNLDIARKSFARIKDLRSLQLIQEVREMMEEGETEVMIKAHILSYLGRFREVAALYRQHGYENKAMELFTELRMFEDAQDVMTKASGETQKMLMRKQADWAKNTNQPKVAAEMLMNSGDFDKAVQLIIDNDWMDLAITVTAKLDRGGDIQSQKNLAKYFETKGEYNLALKIYNALGDQHAVVLLHVNAGHWADAFAIADRFPKYIEDVYVPYARDLAENDKFEEAQKAFHKAGKEKEALQVLEQLTNNAVTESRFADAGYYHWLLSMQYLERAKEHPELIPKHKAAAELAELFYAYDAIFLYCHQPFTTYSMEVLLNMARFVVSKPVTPHVSRALTYFTMAKVGRELGAFKLAREALDALSELKIPPRLQQTVDIMALTIRAKPFSDAEELLPMCYRCGMTNSLSAGSECLHCKTPFVFSFATFENVPMIEFYIEDGIDEEEAKKLIAAEPPLDQENFNPFRSTKDRKSNRVVLGREALAKLEKGQVIVMDCPPPLTHRYFFNVMPTFSLCKCPSCLKIFQLDDYEMAVLQKGHCPFCRTLQTRSENGLFIGDEDLDEEST